MAFFGKSKKTEKSFARKKRLSVAVLGILAIGAVSGLAACKDDKIKYSFNTDGGVAIGSVSIGKGKEYELPIPVKEGYAFEGWYTNANFEGEPVTTVVAEKSMTYYAKWTQLSLITLELDDGTLAQTKLYLKAGENLYEFMQNYKPTKEGLVFGAWFDGTVEIAETATMPEDGITLTAKYKVAYTTEMYMQKLDLSGYEKAEDVVAYEYVGKAFTSVPEVTGFKEVVKDATVSTGATIASKDALSATASENLFRHYFDRESYTVTFDPNYPAEGGSKEAKSETLVYGNEIAVPNDYEYEGYCLVGWATSASATEAEYNAYYVDTMLYNKEGEARAADKFLPERDTNLYAVWAKGYVDLFGGNDNVYLFGEEDEAYLSRGNVFFKGEYDAELSEVYFSDLVGKLYENNTFSYYNDGKVFTLRKGQELDKSTTLTLINNTATYTVEGVQSVGTFVKGEDEDCFVITYSTGDLAGQEMTVKTRIMSITDEDGKQSKQAVFNVRNEQEAALGGEAGGLFRVMMESDGSVGAYYPFVSFDGFGVATLTAPSSKSTYYYTIEDSKLTLSSAEGGSSALDGIIFELNGVTVYAEYKKVLDQTFTLASGDTLKLDGGCKATYTVGGVAKEGYYAMSTSKSGALISVWAGTEQYKFLIEEHKEEKPIVGGEAGEMETVTTYTIESKPIGYAEYRYVENGSVYWAPLIVLDDTVAGKAALYAAYKDSTEYVKISVGSYQLVDGYYVYTVDSDGKFEVSGLNEEPFNLTEIKSVVFQVNTTATDYNLMYWKAYTKENNEVTDYVKEYESTSGAALKLVGGFAFLTDADESSFMGAYATKDGITTIINGSEYRYVELGTDNTFVLLQYAPYKANTLTENDEVNSKEYVEFDGKGNATHVTVITAATNDTSAVTESKAGTAKDTGTVTLTGEKIYEFKANDNSLSFKYINVPDTTYIAKLSDTYKGTYETADEILKLDGFGYKAEYIDEDGNKYTGLYTVTAANEITFYVEEEEKAYYFDLKTSNTFTVRNDEYGSYLLVDNQSIQAYIDLDGYNKASVYTLKEEGGEFVEDYIDQNGTYEQNGSIFTIRYKDGNQQIELEAKLSSIVIDGTEYRTVTVICRDAVRVYVNEDDWSILILDEIGNAVKYNEEGVKEEGTYVLVTEDFLYYASKDLQDACVYEYSYDKEKNAEFGTATPVKFNNTSYYTSDLERLLFSEYGYAYFGATRYYYHEDAQGNVLLYRHAKEGEQPNKYGFVEDTTFGSFAGDVKVYDGKTYYKNSGFGITFDRIGETYPVQISNNNQTKYAIKALTFTPGAGDEYVVMGSVLLNGVGYDCYVVREFNEANELVMYVNIGYYCFYIDVTYNGTQSSYQVTSLEYVRSVYSYNYLYTYFLNMLFFGTSLEDRYGMVHICAEYNEQGEITKQYIDGDFLEGMGLKDKDGNIITFEDATYSYSRGIYGATFTAQDGNTYTLYFGLQYQSALGRYGYTVAALARHQTMTTDNGYEVTVERVVFSELSTISKGTIYTLSLKKGTQELTPEALLSVDDTIYYVVRERAAAAAGETLGKITSTKYYHIKFTEEETGDSVEGGTTTEVLDFKAVTVEEEEVKTYYMENGVVYVDVSDTRGVAFIVMADAAYVVTESSYDETTKTYSGTLAGGGTFTVVMLDGGLVDVTINLSTEA